MKTLKRLLLIAATLCCFIQVQGADDYSDSKRPYEFGFTIDGQQHRHEKKDKNGIIMGEFGFITADDVYHVTVYATDENGRFRILSMKNIHLKATPDYTQGYRQGHSLQLPTATLSPTLSKPTSVEPSSALIPQQPTQKPQNNFKPIPIEPPVNSCSHCSLPTTSTVAPKPAISPNVQSNNNNYNSNPNLFNTLGISGIPYSQGGISPSKYPGQQNAFSTPLSSEPVNGGGQYSQGVSSPSNYPYQQNTVNKPSNVSPPVFSRPNQQNVIGSTLTGQAPLTSANPYNPSPNYPQNTISGTQYPQQANQGPNYSQISPLNSISSYKPQNQNGVSYANDNGGIAGGLSEVEKQAKSYSQTQAPGAAPSNNAVPYNLQSNNEIRYPAQNLSPTLSSSNAEKYSPSNSQAGLSNSLGSRTGKQFSQTPPKASGFNQQNYPLSGTSVPGLQGGPSVPTKPRLVSAQMQLVDKNTDINYKRPGEKNGLPEGLTENDMMNLLYTFNYTLGFQAHYEQGYSNGFKQGYYYVTGRNGIRTRIDYTADNTGFHPKISQDVLDLLSDDVPKPETEKDAKYGLRGYEFKWLYYPVEHKTQ